MKLLALLLAQQLLATGHYWQQSGKVLGSGAQVTTRPTVGDTVRITGCDDDTQGTINMFGEIISDDHSDEPFQVRLSSGAQWWYRASQVQKTELKKGVRIYCETSLIKNNSFLNKHGHTGTLTGEIKDGGEYCWISDKSGTTCNSPPSHLRLEAVEVPVEPEADQTPQSLLGSAVGAAWALLPKQQKRCVHVTFVGDKSESMQSMGRAPKDGARQLIEKMQRQRGRNTDIHLHFVCFNTRVDTVYNGSFADMVPADIERCVESLTPSGRTRLYDTAIEALRAQQAAVAASRASDPDAVVEAVFALITDGIDNESRPPNKGQHGADNMRSLVEEHRQSGATLMFFVAANQNAKETGRDLGFEAERTLQLGSDEQHALGGFTALADTVSKAAAGKPAEQCVFTEKQRGFAVSEEERLRYDPEAAKQAEIAKCQLAVNEQLCTIADETHNLDMLRGLMTSQKASALSLVQRLATCQIAHPVGDFARSAGRVISSRPRKPVTAVKHIASTAFKRHELRAVDAGQLKEASHEAEQSLDQARQALQEMYVALRRAQLEVEAPGYNC